MDEIISFDEWSRKCQLQITLCDPEFREKAKYIWDSAMEAQAQKIKELESFRTAYMEWSDKTDWVQNDKRFNILKPWGKHRADVLREYILRMESGDNSSPAQESAEHRLVIEMLLNVCGAAFELADDSCQQDVDGENCHVVPDDSFKKLSDALDEIENKLPSEYADLPGIILAWAAIPRAALKSLLEGNK